MPELPEVQTIVNDLNSAGLIGRTIINVQTYWAKTIATHTPNQFKALICNRVIQIIPIVFQSEP